MGTQKHTSAYAACTSAPLCIKEIRGISDIRLLDFYIKKHIVILYYMEIFRNTPTEAIKNWADYIDNSAATAQSISAMLCIPPLFTNFCITREMTANKVGMYLIQTKIHTHTCPHIIYVYYNILSYNCQVFLTSLTRFYNIFSIRILPYMRPKSLNRFRVLRALCRNGIHRLVSSVSDWSFCI